MKTKTRFILKTLLPLSITICLTTVNTFAETSSTENTQELKQETSVLKNEPIDINIKINNIIKNTPNFTPTDFVPKTKETKNTLGNVYYTQKETIFENKDSFSIFRFNFKENKDDRFKTTIKLEGNTITVRYINPATKQWVNTSNLKNLMHTTLFIDTDTNSYIVSVPAVYKNDFTNSTLTILPEEEQQVTIEKQNGYFDLKMSFKQSKDLIGEFWFMKSAKRLVDWSKKENFDELLPHDLSLERRWAYDGYYFPTPHNYYPGGKNVLYKNPANYTGASWAKYGKTNLAKNMGYIMTETCMKNQNALGYWETGPKSLWLEQDFKIGPGFYDTRFNTDFAMSLLAAYQNYNNKEFLASALRYAEFFIKHANENSYKTENGGLLVEDYGYHKGKHERTHVSLNHQLAEMNFLYKLYSVTKEKSYLEIADKMLIAIESTRNRWVLPDNNLVYALMYSKNTNPMVDYPYLTYNDLYETKNILKTYFGRTSDTIEYLMAAKKQWMDKNKITNYLGYVNTTGIVH